ncbi:MBL fold metallo-hydrolase [Pseudomonas sp. BN414]|uniref:MBL fold metallo-hydrolase n=1 Tax=Pseudomonas sp. BN414 TaxID=2567888 RepID=UPI002454023B|nr:MBL fold metallo-hydrolase [Pseudomonas sp. BN414]MDH4569658.1 MBL fold metallo-hydrolase [Pseudomonas sp. BN414]
MDRRLSILTGQGRRLDGGVVFGSVPHRVWTDWIRPDQDNQVDLPSRALLVQQDCQNILVLAGCDMLLAPLPRTCRCQQHTHGLIDGLAQLGLAEGDIHVVVLTHLHAVLAADVQVAVRDGDIPRLLFHRARYLVGKRHWLRALRPHPRDRGLFVPQVLGQLEASGRLNLLDGGHCELLGADWRFHVSDGHTPGQLLPEIHTSAGPLVFAGDLVPGTPWLQLDVTSGHDRNPECLVEEKEQLLDHLVANRGRLVLARDPWVAMIRVTRDRQSRYQAYDEHPSLLRLEA